MTHRVVKISLSATSDKFSARSTNRKTYEVSGPFSKQAIAERAMVSILATHTCLDAKVLTPEQLVGMSKESSFDIGHEKHKVVKTAVELFDLNKMFKGSPQQFVIKTAKIWGEMHDSNGPLAPQFSKVDCNHMGVLDTAMVEVSLLANGTERIAHDGSTYNARKKAAKEIVDAYDQFFK